MTAAPGVAALRVARLVAVVMVLQALLLGGLALIGAGAPRTPAILVVSSRTDWAGLVANRINAVDGHPVRAYVGGSEASAADDLRADTVQGYVVVDPTVRADALTISSAQGDPTVIQQVVARASSAAGREVDTTDLTPYAVGDGAGRVGYWFVLSLIVAGIAFATGALRTSAFSGRGGILRWLLSAIGASAATAAVGVGVTCWIVPSWTDHALGLWWIGAAAMATATLLVRAGASIAGRGGATFVVISLLLIGADAGAAGAFGFGRAGALWQPLGPLTPVGAAVSAVRELVELEVRPSLGHAVVLGWWSLAAAAIVGLTRVNRGASTPPEDDRDT
ncbi:hypothetical protein [Calidifontibacter terrae]